METHIYLGKHKVDDIQIVHMYLDEIPRIGELIGINIEKETISARVHDVEWLLDDYAVNIFLD